MFPRGAFFPKIGGKIVIVFGKPWRYEKEEDGPEGKILYQALADRVIAEISKLEP
jgi:hypothetical protein